jgi:hypothetical protein
MAEAGNVQVGSITLFIENNNSILLIILPGLKAKNLNKNMGAKEL